MLRALIIDDEENSVKTLKMLIDENTPQLRVVSSTTDPHEGIRLIEDYKPDAVFLDISMPLMNGFDLVSQLKHRDFKLVFTTAHNEYALKAIKNRAHDYLLKPIDIEELQTCVAGIVSEMRKEKPAVDDKLHIIEVNVKNGVIFINPVDIIRMEASGSYTVFYMANNTREIVSKNLKECEAMLEPPYFYRCHPSHIINLKKAVKLISNDGLFIQMSDGSMPEISRKNKDILLEKLKNI